MEDVKHIDTRSLILMGCLLALSFVVSYMFAAVVAAYGTLLILRKKSHPFGLGILLGTSFLLLGAYLVNMLNVEMLINVAIAVLAGIATAYLQDKGRLSWNLLLWMVVVFTLIPIARDVVAAYLQGTNVIDLYNSYLQSVAAFLAKNADVDTQQALSVSIDIFKTYWPVSYMVNAALVVALARTGCKMVQKGLKSQYTKLSIESLRISKVFAITLLFGAAAQFIGPRLPYYQDSVYLIGANILFFARIVCFLQGVSLFTYFLHTKTQSKVLIAFLYVVAVLVDIDLFIVSAIGFVDAFADIRRLFKSEA